MRELAKRISALFEGLRRAYGTYRVTTTEASGKKVGEAVTLAGQVTDTLWVKHLSGETGIGIIPIRDDSTCLFGAIDVDKYDGLDYGKIIKEIRTKKYPLVPCMSKSGGLHLFLFASKPVKASVMRSKLTSMAASIGFGGSEIFPKQDKVLAERGDFGSWINMPYFDVEKTSRPGLDDVGAPLSIAKFLDAAEARKTDVDALEVSAASTGDLSDGPPCLQYIIERGEVSEDAHNRNVVLFNVAVYLKKAVGDGWEEKLTAVNERIKNPLSRQEVTSIYKSVRRREYFYACTKPPLCQFCDRGVCRGRKYGIGAEGDFPILTSLTKYNTVPPIWFVDVEGGGRIELQTEDLQNQIRFQRRCLDYLNRMPPVIKPEQWRTLVQSLLEKMVLIDVPDDASCAGQFWLLVESFCTARAQARTKEEILLGKPWLDRGRHYFRIQDLMDYLERKRFREFRLHKSAQVLKERGGEHCFMKIRAKGMNLWSVPEFEKRSEEELPLEGLGDDKEPI